MATRNEPTPDREEMSIDDALRERIAQRAYEISQTDEAGTEEENWLRAEQEIRASAD
jgi:Protein of unknown function (DUF2934)